MRAITRHIRMSPRKIRLVADLVRGKSVVDAETQLTFMRKDAAGVVLKTLQSAIANAVDQYDAAPDALVLQTITVDAGSTLKRWRPRAFGRAAPIRKRSAHVAITLSSAAPLKKKERETVLAAKTVTEKPHDAASVAANETSPQHTDTETHAGAVSDPRKVGSRHEPSRTRPEGKKSKGFLKTMFSRKTG